MNKYYVTWGDLQFILLAGNPVAACMLSMRKQLEKYTDVVGTMFRVSQRGHDLHDDDFTISLTDVVNIQILSNEFTGVGDE